MIVWPFYADQQVNSRLVGEVWRVGVDMKDICDRKTIEKAVRELMEVRREEFLKSSKEMARLARKSINEGGSSYVNLDCLIKDIKHMIRKF
ncbi:UNVERIFIED_CONTAM: 7-deoxyloganetic acid glucosyl transferase [Sesamum calycinum]|uniref:7-deoxyloganetic acid glucosyl transferase n=1 Tax=Sesamum calycinum TaxID=2727403 RepID=A0AAW2RPX7_9LAMI